MHGWTHWARSRYEGVWMLSDHQAMARPQPAGVGRGVHTALRLAPLPPSKNESIDGPPKSYWD